MNGYTSKRTNASQSFGYDELMAILDTEAKRPIFEEKRNIRLIDYSLAEEWLKEIGININPFNDKNSVKQVIEKGNKIKETIGELTLEKVKNGGESFKILIERITGYLGQEGKLEKSDLIFVFGGKDIGRIQKAVELWKAGWAPKIWISGGHPIYQEYEPEALTFKKLALEAGVPENCIYTEPDSITIADNCRRSLNLMEEKEVKFERMIIIISWYAQKRAWMMMEKYLPNGVELINSKALRKSESQVFPMEWYKSDYGINIIFNEFLKMRVHDSLVMGRLI